MKWKVMRQLNDEKGEPTEKLLENVEFLTFEEAEDFVYQKIDDGIEGNIWVVPAEPVNKDDYFIQPADAIRVVSSNNGIEATVIGRKDEN